MARKSAIGTVMQQNLLPQIQQIAQQNTAAIMQAIQSIPQPEGPGIDPRMLQNIEAAVRSIAQTDVSPLIASIASISEQIDALPTLADRPNEWTFDVKRNPQTHFIESVKVTPA